MTTTPQAGNHLPGERPAPRPHEVLAEVAA
jgi:hypothetical protein